MTIAEKILATKGGRDVVRPGDIVTVEVDTVILFDNNFTPANWRDILKVRDPERIVVVLDPRAGAKRDGRWSTRHCTRFREEIRDQTRARRRIRSGDQSPARRRPGIRLAGDGARVQRFAHVQRGRVQLPRSRRRRT
jgi:hypothetical protein